MDILSYCLMPNHFHFLVLIKENIDIKNFYLSYRTFFSSYTQAINKQEKRTGSLFRQNAKMKAIANIEHGAVCFHYIHQNPLKA